MMNVDRSAWGQLRVTGADRVRFLMGLTTVNVEALADGAHGWGASLNPKGRVLAVVHIARPRGEDAFVITTEPSLTDKTRAILEKHAVMDDVAFEPMSGPLHQELGSPWDAPFLPGAGDTPEAAAEVLRIRAGFVRYGVDVGEDHFPFETPLGRFLDYGKGCYIGQEPVFRVHAQGNTANLLRGLVVAGDAPIAGGAVIHHAAKDRAGAVTSSVAAGDGTTLALGYVHRSAWEVGGTVTIDGRTATVHELPL